MPSLFYQRLDTVGDGTGTENMAVDGSSTPVTFKIKTSIFGQKLNISRIMIYVQDSGTMDAAEWGNGITLTNGIDFKHKNEGVTSNILGFSIKSAGDMTSVCHDISHEAFGTGDEFISWRWTFTKAGMYLENYGHDSDELQVVINDDLTGLEAMYVIAQGYYS